MLIEFLRDLQPFQEGGLSLLEIALVVMRDTANARGSAKAATVSIRFIECQRLFDMPSAFFMCTAVQGELPQTEQRIGFGRAIVPFLRKLEMLLKTVFCTIKMACKVVGMPGKMQKLHPDRVADGFISFNERKYFLGGTHQRQHIAARP